MNLGTFSVSLAVKDIAASRKFYETLGFSVIDGNQDDNWLILQNGEAKVGLFQEMFEKNILTFNPRTGDTEVRDIQAKLKAAGIALVVEAKDDNDPAHIVFYDPDGNQIMIDQHLKRDEV